MGIIVPGPAASWEPSGARAVTPTAGPAAVTAGQGSVPGVAPGDPPEPRAPGGQPASRAGLLAAAVAGIGGSPRPGQEEMAAAVEHAIGCGEHLAVQAGTGTGKSLA